MISRRSFLRQAACAGLLTATPLAKLSAYAGTKAATQPSGLCHRKRVGHGDFRYRVDKKWGTLDAEVHPVQHCLEMVQDARGRLLVTTAGPLQDVLVYNKRGQCEAGWNLGLDSVHGLTVAGTGSDQTLWITDTTGRVLNVDLDGRVIRELNVPFGHLPGDVAYQPTGTAVAPNGDIYVADGYGSNQVFHYDGAGRLKNVFGGPTHFDCCHGLAVDDRRSRPELLITSRGAQSFQRWTLDGKHLATHHLPGLYLCRPVLSGEQTLFAVISTKSWQDYDGMIAVLDKGFRVVSLPGGSAPTSQTDFTDVVYDGRTFLNPHDVCVDDHDNLYVPQWFSGKTYPVRLKRK